MNKRLIVMVSSAVVISTGLISCVSAQKNSERHVAGLFDAVSNIVQKNKENYDQIFGEKALAKPLLSSEIEKYATSKNIPLKDAELIIDNDASFDAKIKTIRNAKREIRLSYYIYSDDDSSAVLTQELINQAKKGRKVKLLVDYITNYSRMDLFKYMQKEGQGNIDIRFYNFPSERLQRDAVYMTLPCPTGTPVESEECKNYKLNVMKTIPAGETTIFAKLFLAGLYGKNPTALQTAMGLGAQITPDSFKSDEKMSEEDQSQLLEFFKLYYRAKVKGSISAKIGVMIAMQMHGEELTPIVNQITGRLPMIDDSPVGSKEKVSHAKEWDHFTDYTHHKLVMADDDEWVNGGRNIEDSYHMRERLGTKGKYIFMDTDFRGVARDGQAKDIADSFDKTFNFKTMVATMSDVERVTPFDYVKNDEALLAAAKSCEEQIKNGKIDFKSADSCVINTMKSNKEKFLDTNQRLAVFKKEFIDSYNRYTNEYARKPGKKVYKDSWRSGQYSEGINRLTAEDIKTAEVYYVENNSFNIKEKNPTLINRHVGSRIGAEEKFNKNIHKLWYKSLENACYLSQAKKQDVRVVFHTAYLFLPTGLVHKIAKMMNGDYGDCSRVHMTFLTNSFETTDLNVVNVFARYQMSQLFKHYYSLLTEASTFRRWVPRMDYYEYNAAATGAGISLHTKLSLFGNDIVIGSANADTRSYVMDTNNAVFIRNARDLAREYKSYIDRIVSDRNRTQALGEVFANMTDAQIKTENDYILGAMICRWDKKAQASCPPVVNGKVMGKIKATDVRSERMTPEKIKEALEILDNVGSYINTKTSDLLKFRGEFDAAETYQYDTGSIERQLNIMSNEFDDFFKVL